MFREQIGKLQQPLDNMVIEEIERNDGIKDIYFVIAMQSLPVTAPIANGVNNYAYSEQRIGSLYVSRAINPEDFKTPFDLYSSFAYSMEAGKTDTIYHLDLPIALDNQRQIITSRFLCIAMNRGEENHLIYTLGTELGVEHIMVGSPRINPLPNDRIQAVMGYLFASKDNGLVENFKESLIQLVDSNNNQRGTLTRAQYGFTGDVLSALYKAHKKG